jgi:hypothetical protein
MDDIDVGIMSDDIGDGEIVYHGNNWVDADTWVDAQQWID